MIPSEELLQSVLTQWFRSRSVPNQLCFNDSVRRASQSVLPQWFRPMSSQYRVFLSDSVQWAPPIGSFSVVPSKELHQPVLPRWTLSPMQSCRSLHPLYSACQAMSLCRRLRWSSLTNRALPRWTIQGSSPIGSAPVVPSKALHQSVLLQWFRLRRFTNRFCSSGSVQGSSPIGSAPVVPSKALHQSALLQWFRPRRFTNRFCVCELLMFSSFKTSAWSWSTGTLWKFSVYCRSVSVLFHVEPLRLSIF